MERAMPVTNPIACLLASLSEHVRDLTERLKTVEAAQAAARRMRVMSRPI